ncbi:MAG: hypothetical protein ACR2P5_05825, partial [Gammaproteobacteria bacterium]
MLFWGRLLGAGFAGVAVAGVLAACGGGGQSSVLPSATPPPASPVGGYGRDDDRNIVFCDATGKKLNGGAGESSSANTSARH